MFFSSLFSLSIWVTATVLAAPFPFDETTIKSPDGSIMATFISLGATMTELWVKDRFGKARDVILGYDDNTKLLTDPAHPYFNPIVGRYANRIKNGTFSIPISRNPPLPPGGGPNVFHIPENDHNGLDTLHGSFVGWDHHNWTMTSRTSSSITYKHIDAGDENFPGTVTAFATFTVSNRGTLQINVKATATEKTPIMVAAHTYLNLDAFQGTSTVLNHTLSVDASRVIAVDGILVPTGKLIQVDKTPFDFRKPMQIGSRFDKTVGLCGPGCQGYDHCWIYDHVEQNGRIGTSLWSDMSGIRLDITTNQAAVQVYTSNFLNVPRKVVHGGPSLNYSTWSAVAIEQESWIAGINNPEWHVDQIYGPDRPYEWSSTLKFSTFH